MSHSPVDITSARHKADPFPTYQRWRESGTAQRVRLPNRTSAWIITRYDDARAAFQDARLVKNRYTIPGNVRNTTWIPGFVRPLLNNMLDVDEPDHTRLRSLVNKAFTPSRVEALRGEIEAICHRQLALVRSRSSWDFVQDFALPIPAMAIARMLGVPPQDFSKFARWSNSIAGADASHVRTVKAIPSIVAFWRYIRRLIKTKQMYPEDDLMTALIEAEEAGDRLSRDELVAMVFLLLMAGFETTVNLIGNAMLTLLDESAAMRRLREEPELMDCAVEEFLRFCGPLDVVSERFASEPMELAGTPISQGALVYIAVCSANRDGAYFEKPDTFVIDRTPNPHLTFGLGTHFCLGAALGRLEAQLAFRTLLQHTQSIELAVDASQLRWKKTLITRGLVRLPVSVSWNAS